MGGRVAEPSGRIPGIAGIPPALPYQSPRPLTFNAHLNAPRARGLREPYPSVNPLSNPSSCISARSGAQLSNAPGSASPQTLSPAPSLSLFIVTRRHFPGRARKKGRRESRQYRYTGKGEGVASRRVPAGLLALDTFDLRIAGGERSLFLDAARRGEIGSGPPRRGPRRLG